jgi:hypothetical protein
MNDRITVSRGVRFSSNSDQTTALHYAMWRPGQIDDDVGNRFQRWFAEWKCQGSGAPAITDQVDT